MNLNGDDHMATEPGGAKQQHTGEETSGAQKLPAQGTVLEACYNMSGNVLATSSSDDVVQIWTASSSGWLLVHTEQLPAHPTHLAWAHPQHGQLLAVGTTAGQVHIIQAHTPGSCRQPSQQAQANSLPEQQQQQGKEGGWHCTSQLHCGNTAVSALAFAPHQQGLVLAAACRQQQAASTAQGRPSGSSHVQLWEAPGQASSCVQWTLISSIKLPQSAGVCHCLCWHPATPGLPPLLLGGTDSGGCVWAYNSSTMMWQELGSFVAPAGASAAALSVHWAPALGRPYELIAASFGSMVVLYKVQQSAKGVQAAGLGQLGQLDVLPLQEFPHPAPVWKLEFNMMGTTLACSLDGKPEVWLWMPAMDGPWAAVSKIAGSKAGSQVDADSGLVD